MRPLTAAPLLFQFIFFTLAPALIFPTRAEAKPRPARQVAQAVPPGEPGSPTPVMEILFEGLVTREPAALLMQLSTKQGEPYNALLLREDITRLAAVFRRADARTEPLAAGGIRVIFRVEEYPKLRKLKFVGNHKISTPQAEKIAALKPGDPLEDQAVKSLRRALLEEYRSLGLNSARIDVTTVPVEEVTPEEADLQIVIQEGEQTVVDGVEIIGNKVFSTVRLKLQVQTKGSWWFIKNYYDDTAFEDDLAALRQFYNGNGYFDAKIERGDFKSVFKGGRQHLTPVIRITEGEPYQLNEVTARGARLFSRGELLEPFKELTGKPFDGTQFNAALDKVRTLYLDHGFLSTEVKADYDFDTAKHGVNVTLNVIEQDRIYVGKVRIARPLLDPDPKPSKLRQWYDRIAPPVSEAAILREVLLKPGEVYSKRRERETIRRLDRTGLFYDEESPSTVRITNEPTANPKVHDVLIEVREGVTGTFGVGTGFGDVSGLFGFVNFQERNLFGEARDLRLQIQIGTRLSDVTLSYLDRHYQGTDDQLALSAYYNLFRRDGYRERVIGARAEKTHPLYGGWDRALRVRLEHVGLDEDKGINASEDLNASYAVLAGRVLYRNDTRYPFFNPTEGRMLSGALEAGYAGGPLIKLTGEAEYYYQLRRKLTYRLNPSFGLMPFEAGTVGLGERLFLGGSGDLRGFRYRGAGLRDSKEDKVAVGGSIKTLVRNELLFPVVDPVWGVFFVDAGTLGSSPLQYWEAVRLSTGVGVRVRLRPVTLSLDFGLPLIQGDGDQTQFIHFTFKGQL